MAALQGKVALVTGASRGCGKGIALQLGASGATVYITSLRPDEEDPIIQQIQHKLPTLEQVAEEINSRGGVGIPVYCDHSNDLQVAELFKKIAQEQNGQLDILINNAFSAVTTMLRVMHTKFFELPLDVYETVMNVGVRGHYHCAYHAARLMVPRRQGLIVEISSPGGGRYVFNVAYGVGKAGNDRLAADMAIELKEFGITCISLWPGPVKTELFSKEVGLLNNGEVDKAFCNGGESPEFAGKCIVAFAIDPTAITRTGHVMLPQEMAKEYNIHEEDGSIPYAPLVRKQSDFVQHLNELRSEIGL